MARCRGAFLPITSRLILGEFSLCYGQGGVAL